MAEEERKKTQHRNTTLSCAICISRIKDGKNWTSCIYDRGEWNTRISIYIRVCKMYWRWYEYKIGERKISDFKLEIEQEKNANIIKRWNITIEQPLRENRSLASPEETKKQYQPNARQIDLVCAPQIWRTIHP